MATKRVYFPGLDKMNPKYQPIPYMRGLALMPSPYANLSTALGFPVNNAIVRSRYYSPQEINRVEPYELLTSKRVPYRYVGNPGRQLKKPMFGDKQMYSYVNVSPDVYAGLRYGR